MNTIHFIHDLTWTDLPPAVQNQARRCLLDTVGTAIGGRQTALSGIIHDFAATMYAGPGAQLWLDGRPVSPPGAALANGMTIDALDIHDGHPIVKGHAGAAVVPAIFATLASAAKEPVTGPAFLTGLVVGYEIALRAGVALHATACDYHTSGAWNALGCAALTARRLGLTAGQTWHALGIAEYHGPRSQMMRCIDHPTMLKDGSGWGAMVGVSAAFLAQAGFSGAPAVTVEEAEVAEIWAELSEAALNDPAVLRLVDAIELIEDEKFNARFPGHRFARVEIETAARQSYSSGEVEAKWDAVDPPSDQALQDKFGWLAGEYLPADRAASLASTLWQCDQLSDARALLPLLAAPVY